MVPKMTLRLHPTHAGPRRHCRRSRTSSPKRSSLTAAPPRCARSMLRWARRTRPRTGTPYSRRARTRLRPSALTASTPSSARSRGGRAGRIMVLSGLREVVAAPRSRVLRSRAKSRAPIHREDARGARGDPRARLGRDAAGRHVLKDLGKVHGFLASIFGGSDAATSRQFLAEALQIQQHLDRPAECETENIQRLMRDRPNNLTNLEAGDPDLGRGSDRRRPPQTSSNKTNLTTTTTTTHHCIFRTSSLGSETAMYSHIT